MCSSTRGPAIAPSLVTWPMRNSAVPLRLGVARELRRALAHLRHRAGRRLQRLGPQRLDRIDHRDAAAAPPRARRAMRSSCDLGEQMRTPAASSAEAPRAQRDLLRRFLARHVENRAARAVLQAPAAAASTCRCPDRRRAAPPAPPPGRRRARGRARRCRSPCAPGRVARPRQARPRRRRCRDCAARCRVRSTVSVSVPGAPQDGHAPNHCSAVAPHSEQT